MSGLGALSPRLQVSRALAYGCTALLCWVPGLHAQQGGTAAAIAAARAGGTIILCRHGITGSFREREPVDYDDPTTQRQLDRRGEEQSRRIGAALRRLGVEVIELVASPMHRAYRTAELMFDQPVRIDSIWHTNGSDYRGPARDARLRFLARPVSAGNVLIISHIGTMSSVVPEVEGAVGEGDCVVVRPARGGHDVVGIVDWRAWIEAAEGVQPFGLFAPL
jgi:phosphohistidine phosphatase SixA